MECGVEALKIIARRKIGNQVLTFSCYCLQSVVPCFDSRLKEAWMNGTLFLDGLQALMRGGKGSDKRSRF